MEARERMKLEVFAIINLGLLIESEFRALAFNYIKRDGIGFYSSYTFTNSTVRDLKRQQLECIGTDTPVTEHVIEAKTREEIAKRIVKEFKKAKPASKHLFVFAKGVADDKPYFDAIGFDGTPGSHLKGVVTVNAPISLPFVEMPLGAMMRDGGPEVRQL